MAGEVKRSAVRARKAQSQLIKGTRRKQRPAAEPRVSAETLAKNQTITRYPGQGVSITVQIPPLRRQKTAQGTAATSSSRGKLLAPILIIPILLLAVGYGFFGGDNPSKDKIPSTPSTAAAAVKTEPAYKPLIPSAEKASATKYDGKRDLVTYTTMFSGAKITVSQQPLPANFSKDPQAITKAADSIQAKQRLETDKGDVYIMTNEEAGDQMALFAGKQTLVFIHSASKMDDTSWKSFIELLEAKSWEELI